MFNPLGVSRDSMRAPVPRSSLERFFGKKGLPFEKFDTLFHFLTPSRARVRKMTLKMKSAKVIDFYSVFVTLPQKGAYFTRGVTKIGFGAFQSSFSLIFGPSKSGYFPRWDAFSQS